jgi:hypothetical protein
MRRIPLVDNPAELLLVGNPRKRRRGSRKARRRASPAQRRARARFAAMARARSHAARPRRRARRHAVALNPIRHRRRARHHVARRRFRRNPIRMGGYLRGYVPMLKSAGVGATGAILNDVAYGFALPFLPAMMATPVSASGGMNPAYYLGKIGTAFALGAIGSKVIGSRAATMTEGALTVTIRDAIKQMLISFGIAVPMGAALNPGRVTPPLPISQNLRKYIGPTAARGGMRMYVVPGASTGSREMMVK